MCSFCRLTLASDRVLTATTCHNDVATVPMESTSGAIEPIESRYHILLYLGIIWDISDTAPSPTSAKERRNTTSHVSRTAAYSQRCDGRRGSP